MGVLLGGLLTSGPGWQWIFYVNVPVGVLVIVMMWRLVPAARPPAGARLDLAGALLVTAAAALVIYGLINAGEAGWGATSTLATLAVGLLLATAFLLVQRRSAAPLVRPGLLAQRPMVAGNLVMLAASGILISLFFLTSMYLQRAQGFTALRTGLVFLPAAVVIGAGAHLAGRLVPKLGGRPVAGTGFAGAAAGLLWMAAAPDTGRVWMDLMPGFLLAAVGIGAVFVTATTVSDVPVFAH